MSHLAKVGLVIAGYVAAVVAGVGAAWLYNAWAAAQPYNTSGGMYAAGEAMSTAPPGGNGQIRRIALAG